jgi:hypothetical protein
MAKAMFYMTMVTADLGSQSVVNDDNFYKVVNIVARFVYVLSNTMVPVALAGCEMVFSQFAKFLSGANTQVVDLTVGFLSSAAVKVALDRYMLTLLSENVTGLISLTKTVVGNKRSNFIVTCINYFKPNLADMTVDHINNVFRVLRDSLMGVSKGVNMVLGAAAFASFSAGVATTMARRMGRGNSRAVLEYNRRRNKWELAR